MDWKRVLTDYLSFSRTERIAVLVLVGLIVAITYVPKLVTDHEAPGVSLLPFPSDSGEIWFKRESRAQSEVPVFAERAWLPESASAAETAEMFEFDPNTLPNEGWRKLGVREKTVKTIRNFLAKGGKFYKPSDLGRIYGLSKSDYKRLVPFVRIAEKNNPEKSSYSARTEVKQRSLLDLNTADSADLEALPGIGARLASRIIAFRQKLGGFYSVSQLGETYGLPDSTFRELEPRFLVSPGNLAKHNINLATKEELSRHPYIRYQLANAIVEFRNQHGRYQSVADLKKIAIMTDEIYEKLAAYLVVD